VLLPEVQTDAHRSQRDMKEVCNISAVRKQTHHVRLS